MFLLAWLCFCWEFPDIVISFRPRKVSIRSLFPSSPPPPNFTPSLHEFLHCLYYIFQHASLFLLNTFLAPRFDSNSATWGDWLALRGDQRRAGRQRPNRDSISWRKSSPRKDPVHDSDIRYVAVSSLYSAILSNCHVSRLCDCR